MSTETILDAILIPRPGGSEGLGRVATFLEQTLSGFGAEVTRQAFDATPYGFRTVWLAVLAMMIGWALCLRARRNRAALVLALVVPLLLLAEFEWLCSPLSGLLGTTEYDIVARFPGNADQGLLVFGAHYDTTTHFGDHYVWFAWGLALAPATALALLLPLLAEWRARRGRSLVRWLRFGGVAAVLLPYAAMAWFYAAGPLLRSPSPGALDNGGSVAALVRLAERLAARPAGSGATVELVFFAGEEERALGSWSYARELVRRAPHARVINLESVGASDDLVWITEDGFALRRWQTPPELLAFVQETARAVRGHPLPEVKLMGGTLTDGRSFLAQGLAAVTLGAGEDGGFPRRLHSEHDSRERLSVPAIERTVDLLGALTSR